MKYLNGDELIKHSLYIVFRLILGCKNLKKSRNHLKLPGAGMVA